MTEEEKKKCEEFIKLTISSFEVVNTYENMARDLVMYLAKVFNKDITKEKADYIVDKIIKNEPIQYGSGYEALAYIIERIGWITAEYFDREENINNIDLYINNKFMTEEQKRKCEEIINSYEERYKKDFEKINTLGFHIDGQHTSPIVRMFGIIVGGISAFEFEFGQSEDYLNEYSEFLVKSNNIAGENIIDLTVALSEVFNINMTKEEAEKLLFTKDIEEGYQGDWQSKYSDKFYKSTKEFEHIIEVYIKNSPFYNSKLDTIFSFGMLPHNTNLYMFIFDSVGWAIANYFNGKENYNNKNNEEENKNFNKENKINNVVENTAKEKIMSNNDELTLNLLILGKTGVGKSSLLNALVGKEVEETRSASKPVTKRGIFPHEAEIDGKKVIIHDSWGLEVGKDEEWEKIINNALKEKGIDKDIKDWFHSVTYCIQAGGDRIEDFDLKIIKKFLDDKYNVIVALTKADQINEEKEEKFINTIKKDAGIDTVVSISFFNFSTI